MAFARLLVDDLQTAEDVVQEAFAGLYRRWPALADPDAALAYLRTAVANGARSQLRRRQREVLVLRYFFDLSEAEIAAELQISRGSVEQHASRGLAALGDRTAVAT